MGKILVLLRHGQSIWNAENRFTGFEDIGLSNQGIQEAKRAGELLKNYNFDWVFCSALKRSQDTAKIALGSRLPENFVCNKALNERHYGDLQGKNKDQVRQEFGVEQVKIWRRSFDVRPPGGESLKDTIARVVPYYKQEIEPKLFAGQTILVAAHGNSLRALVKYLENLSNNDVVGLEIPTGEPILYEFDEEDNIKQRKRRLL